jgi:hypothetical protein
MSSSSASSAGDLNNRTTQHSNDRQHVGAGLGSISSLTESVNSWSFGLPPPPTDLPQTVKTTSGETMEELLALVGSDAGVNNLTSGGLVSSTDLHQPRFIRTTDVQTTSAGSQDVTQHQAVSTACSWFPGSLSIAGTPSQVLAPSPARSSMGQPLTGISSNGLAAMKPCRDLPVTPAVRHSRLRSSRPLSGKFQNDGLTLPEDRCQSSEGITGSPQGPSTIMRLDALKIMEDKKSLSSSLEMLADKDLQGAAWYMPDIPREATLEVLAHQDIGSFVVRKSTTNPGCYALTVKVPKYDNPVGISHYLLTRTSQNMIRFKGLAKEWSSVTALITHHSVMRELLPCLLRLPRTSDAVSTVSVAHCDKENTNYERRLT